MSKSCFFEIDQTGEKTMIQKGDFVIIDYKKNLTLVSFVREETRLFLSGDNKIYFPGRTANVLNMISGLTGLNLIQRENKSNGNYQVYDLT